MTTESENKRAAALISPPWALFNRPSIQLGALKSYVELKSDINVVCLHPYLHIARAITIDNYNRIAASGWAGEAVFSALLFPEMVTKAEALFKESLGGDSRNLPSFKSLVEIVRRNCQSWLASINWHELSAAGFSVCFNQLLASLYLSAELKNRYPSLPIIFGGSSCGGELGQSLLAHFHQIDYTVDGEGEIPLTLLCKYILGESRQFPSGVFKRGQSPSPAADPPPIIEEMSDLPVPDYSDYFNQINRIFPDMPFIPKLPLEFSRGCWWNKCTFCNLNLQWEGYRWKKSDKMIRDLTHLSSTHQCLDFTFTDNALPPKEASAFFSQVKDSPADFRFFAEIRAVTSLTTLSDYSRAGLRTVQVGIEAFSSTLLAKMKKGVSVVENVAIMKYAAACGITLEGNLIIEFPGSTRDNVEETLTVLEYVLPFTPLSAASFFLGFHSPVHESPADYGIKGIHHHPNNSSLFPGPSLDELVFISMGYRGDRTFQKKLWKPVQEKIHHWQRFHEQRKSSTLPPLSYRDGMNFLIIRQEQGGGGVVQHRLKGTSRKIYLFCSEIRTVEELVEAFPRFSQDAVLSFIDQLCAKRLMFREKNRVISLAIVQP